MVSESLIKSVLTFYYRMCEPQNGIYFYPQYDGGNKISVMLYKTDTNPTDYNNCPKCVCSLCVFDSEKGGVEDDAKRVIFFLNHGMNKEVQTKLMQCSEGGKIDEYEAFVGMFHAINKCVEEHKKEFHNL